MAPKRRGKTPISMKAKKIPKIDETNKKTVKKVNEIQQLENALDKALEARVFTLVPKIIKNNPADLSSALRIRLLRFCVKVKNEGLFHELFSNQTVNLNNLEGGHMLWEALDLDDSSIASLLIENGADLSFRNPDDQSTNLHKVLTSRRIKNNTKRGELVRMMLDRGADFNACDSKGCSVLHSAIVYDRCSYQLVEELLERGAHVLFGGDPNLDDISAACDSKPGLLPKLIEHQVPDVETRNKRGKFAIEKLMLSKHKNSVRFIKNVLELGIPIPDEAFYVCAEEHKKLPKNRQLLKKESLLIFEKTIAHTKILLDYGANPDYYMLLRILLDDHSIYLFELIFKHRGEVIAHDKQLLTDFLHRALLYNKEFAIKELLNRGAGVDDMAIEIGTKKCSNVLPRLIEWNDPCEEIKKMRVMIALWALAETDYQPLTLFKELLATKKLPIYQEKYGLTLFDCFARRGNFDMIKILLDYGDSEENLTDSDSNIETKKKRAMTALQALVIVEDDNLTYFKKYLAIKDLPIYQERDGYGFTLLDRAVTEQRRDMVEILLDYSDNVKNEIYSAGASSLLIASKLEDYSIVELLIKKGVNIEARNERGLTPLFQATYCNNLKNVKLLVSFGADIEAIDNDGDTPLTWAGFDYYHSKRIELLLRLGADISAVNKYNHVPFFYPKSPDMSRVFIEHIAVLVVQEITVHDENLAIINGDPSKQQHYKTCLEELDKMKSSIIHGNISLFSILVANPHKLLMLMKNSTVVRYFRRVRTIKSKYPIYYKHIAIKFDIAERKRNILNDKIKVLDEISNGALPHFVVEMIAYYASFDEFIHVNIDDVY